MTKRISTNATLQSLKAQDKEYLVPDKKIEGLNIRVRPTGTMTWIFRFQVGKKHEKITMGRYVKLKPETGMTLEQARTEAGRYRSWLENNKNPKQELAREQREQEEAKTFDDAFASFDEKRLSKQLRGEQARAIYSRDIKPFLGHIKLEELRIHDLNKVFDAKVDESGKRKAGAIGACHKIINQVINHALALNMLGAHPAPHLKSKDVGGGSKVTKRNLSFSELKTLLTSLPSWRTEPSNVRLMQFLLGCGQRISAVLEMRWSEVDLQEKVWLLPASSEDRHTKSQESRKVPLSDYLLVLLKEQRESVPSKWKLVWPQLLVDKVQEPAAVRALIKRNLPDDFERFSPHDLRRTFISRCSEMGLDIVAIEKTVGHQLPGMLRVYNHHDYFDEQLAVLQAWGQKLQALVVENVVPLEKTKSA
ncbi:tyrosine-type recombinase/integrase [Vibrio vulnificus]|uniref:tyrosine-type recombinase/integrase n=1 Tax=Vibrio vulnificus TaxID=672 RepID=UPI001029C427|nr:site-specific integrase [Vibrio vulnificus]EGQ8650872.1 tyrosine-type recombinase/integrase [Vibrio cholerae]HCG7110316.1 tyrosine-type recombinase/integrase [Vibrio parahaemolyticus]MBN8108867.1 tyrosine-type recombinase/integrase [Vibrio vulnificus]RZR34810.1 site-specific integrase [Vibrio vulnificus]HAS6396210.1 tyrosine-type recombinase/integrase [Vibrio vulnificus]